MINRCFLLLVFILLIVLNFKAHSVEYELPDLNGQMRSLDQYKGKWVVVNYWATWCSTCMKEIPDLIEFYENNKDKGAVVVAINFETISLPKLKNVVDDLSLPFPVLVSEPVPRTPLGKVPALPTTYIIDPEGRVVAGDTGIVTRENLEDYINTKKAMRNDSKTAQNQVNPS